MEPTPVPDITMLIPYMDSISQNIQILTAIMLGAVGLGVAIGVCLLLYRSISNFL